jgi:hypothetical protein
MQSGDVLEVKAYRIDLELLELSHASPGDAKQ